MIKYFIFYVGKSKTIPLKLHLLLFVVKESDFVLGILVLSDF